MIEVRSDPQIGGIQVADQVTVEKHDEGLPQISSFINSHDNNAIFRRFGRMSARTLVQLQIDLTELEEDLDKLDHNDASDPIHKWRLHGLENYNGWNEDQRNIVAKLQTKLCEYCSSTAAHDTKMLLTSNS